MLNSRPYATPLELHRKANLSWYGLTEEDYLEAFAGHAKIGELSSLKENFANTRSLAASEQSELASACAGSIVQLAQDNRRYEDRFGFIFIVCATGKSAQEISLLLQKRLLNDRETELKNSAEEQRKIFHIRLSTLLE